MGDGEDAQSDGNRSRMMRPNWEKACYRWSAGHMLLKVRFAAAYLFVIHHVLWSVS
jgi:hypothetical protein